MEKKIQGVLFGFRKKIEKTGLNEGGMMCMCTWDIIWFVPLSWFARMKTWYLIPPGTKAFVYSLSAALACQNGLKRPYLLIIAPWLRGKKRR